MHRFQAGRSPYAENGVRLVNIFKIDNNSVQQKKVCNSSTLQTAISFSCTGRTGGMLGLSLVSILQAVK
jgi:hypothetical protein